MADVTHIDDSRAIDALVSNAVSFSVDYTEDGVAQSRQFKIGPPTIGKLALLSKYYEQMDFDEEALLKRPIKEAARIFAEKADTVCRFIAVAVSNTKEELTDNARQDELAEFFRWNADPKLFSVIARTVVAQSDYVNFTNATRLMKIYRLSINTDREGSRVAES